MCATGCAYITGCEFDSATAISTTVIRYKITDTCTEKYLNKCKCVERYLERTQQRLVKRSMFNYVVIQLQFGDFESKMAIKFTLLKA